MRLPGPALALLCFTAVTPRLAGQSAMPDTSAISRYVQSELLADRVPGAAVVVVSREGVIFARGFGETGRRGEPVTPDTPFLLGSMSKSVTAIAVMQLVERGRLALDTPVVRYLPEFGVATPTGERITVRHLLAHTSGLPTLAPRARGRNPDLGDHVAALRQAELEGVPGASHRYSSPNYQVLGRLVERVSGEPFAAYVRRHVFAPLAMNHSATDEPGAREAGLARGHQMLLGAAVPRDFRFESDRLPTAALVASASDLGRFMRAQLNGGLGERGRVLSEAGIASMHRPLVQGEGFSYAMGWRLSELAGAHAVHHGGILPNFRGKMVMLPEKGLAVVVLTNVSSSIGTPTSHRVADGVATMLVGGVPEPARWSLATLYLALALAMVALTANQVRSLVRSVREPRKVRRGVFDLLLGVALLVGLPRVIGFGWGEMLRQMPDVGAWVLLMLGLGLVQGWVRLRGFSSAPAASARKPVAVPTVEMSR